MKQLQEDESLRILPGDKGRALVAIHSEEYVNKCKGHLNDNLVYEKLQNNPIDTLRTQVNKDLQ